MFLDNPDNPWFLRLNNNARIVANLFRRSLIHNKNVTIFSDNCLAGFVYHDLGLRFNSPLINGLMSTQDFLSFCRDSRHYLSSAIVFIDDGSRHPVAKIDNIIYYFIHYKSQEEVLKKWFTRKERVNYENLFIIMTEKEDCTYEDLKEFDSLPFENKVVLTHKPYPEFASAYYIRGFENKDCCGVVSDWKIGQCLGKRYYDDFDFVKWLNKGK